MGLWHGGNDGSVEGETGEMWRKTLCVCVCVYVCRERWICVCLERIGCVCGERDWGCGGRIGGVVEGETGV